MRKITKIRRNIKAISPVISVLLMIAVAVVASLVVYAWVMGFIGGKTNQVGQSVQIQSMGIASNGHFQIYVQNVGQGAITLDPAGSVYINGTQYTSTITPTGPLNPGQTATLDVSSASVALGDNVVVKVVSGSGTYSQVSNTIGQSSSPSSSPTPTPGQNTVSYQTSGTGTATGPQTYTSGTPINIVATVGNGYTFSTWTATPSSQVSFGSPTTPSTTATITGSGTVVITATFTQTQTQYQITVTQTSNGVIAPGTTSYNAGSTPSFTITPNSGYKIASITANSNAVTVTTPAGQTYQFAALSAAGTLTATFTQTQTATKLVFTAGASQSLTAGTVSPTAIVVQLQDASGNPMLASSAIAVSLSTTSSGGKFYSNSAGTTVITQIVIASGSSSSAGFYYKDTVAASPVLTGASNGLTSATTTFTIGAATATQLVFTVAPTTVAHGVVSSVFTVAREDQYGNPTTTGTTTVDLSASTNSCVFYSDSQGTHTITQLSIASGSSSASFYWKYTGTNYTTRTIYADDHAYVLSEDTTNIVVT
jgi:FlaG/FlaF family flagellin (archaellin)